MRTILIAVDFSPVTHDVIQAAVAERREGGGELHLLHVCARSEALSEFEWERQQLAALAALLREQGFSILTRVIHGHPSDEILEEIARLKADLVVVGPHGHSAFYDLVVGSVAEVLLRRSPCPLLIVPSHRTACAGRHWGESILSRRG
jgi:nucleotide-binding universal stress UspA family protein